MSILHSVYQTLLNLKSFEDYILSGMFFAIGCYAYLQATNWGFAVGTWPRLTAGIVVVLSAVVLLQGYLPSSLKHLVTDGETMFSKRQKDATAIQNEGVEDTRTTTDISPAVTTALFVIGYGALAFLIGLLWATPLFVIAHTRWSGVRWKVALTLAGGTFLIAIGFATILNLPLESGWISEVLGI